MPDAPGKVSCGSIVNCPAVDRLNRRDDEQTTVHPFSGSFTSMRIVRMQ